MRRGMMMVGLCGVVGAVAAGWGAAGSMERPSRAAALEAFESLKALEGSWLMLGDDGETTAEVGSVYHVTAGGSAVMETMFPGQPHEMLTVYFMNGETLCMTHYCMLGNRPELAATSIEGTSIEWSCSESSACCGSEDHMHAATFDLRSGEEIATTWRGDKEGEENHEVTFVLRRAAGHGHEGHDHAEHAASPR